ncbi:ImmA/IrrE family metallo-endopeptidase [uncultured Clostridium sp.]|uniref:ImmA/IrrE family metallo-endopeptidase n=1 Tax=uncultured Clostridium sp. TaxID=59620 RepID=UPI00262BD42E|nr:ImmA/IrrE family metallo-endopeptidase [uncultured Clostridium sp.]
MITLNSFELLVEELLCSRNITIYNSRISEIAEKLNINLIFTYSKSTVIKNNQNNQVIILLNMDLEYKEQRLAFFHELTHILLDHLSFCDSLNNFELNQLERQANEFSLALALPRHELKTLFFSKSLMNNIYEISDLYEVSVDLVEKRLLQIKK